MSAISPSSLTLRKQAGFLSSIKPTARHLLGASALLLMSSLPLFIAKQSQNQNEHTENNESYMQSASWGIGSSLYSIGSSVLPYVASVGAVKVVGSVYVARKVVNYVHGYFYPISIFDGLLDSPEAINLQIDRIKREIESGNIGIANNYLNNIKMTIQKFKKFYEAEHVISDDLKTLKNAKKIIEQLGNTTNEEVKKKLIEEVKKIKFKNNQKVFQGVNINGSEDFKKMAQEIQSNITDLEQILKQYPKLKKNYTDDCLTIDLIQVYLSQKRMARVLGGVKPEAKKNALEHLEKIKEHLNEHIQMKKGMKDQGSQTDPEETDLEKLREVNRVLVQRLESTQQQRKEWGDELAQAEAMSAQLAQGQTSTASGKLDKEGVSIGSKVTADNPEKDAQIRDAIGKLEDPNKRYIIAYLTQFNGTHEASQIKEQCYKAIDQKQLSAFLNNVASQFKQQIDLQQQSSASRK
ncbi:MAG: hypothetical protein K1060chlam4_00513 [Candidatus Anoxychlamydiales bacterium]|nr:hypothetical protein [Candidatus Anoxychlamydiales bacterium]